MDMSFRCSPLAVLRRSGEFGEFLVKSMMWWLQLNLWSVSFGIFTLFSSAGHGLEHHIIDFPRISLISTSCIMPTDVKGHKCALLSCGSPSLNGEFGKILGKSMIWWSQLHLRS